MIAPVRRAATAFIAAFLSLAAPAANADKRVALVIGNGNYQHASRLANPAGDTAAMAAALGRLGFQVRHEHDLAAEAMRRKLRDFGAEVAGADVAIVYFAGHGLEIDKQNYLIPVDAQLRNDRDVAYEAVPLDLVMSAVEGARQLRLVLLDACRNNPFAAAMKGTSATRSIGRGLARVEPPGGTVVGFAAKEGTTADDGSTGNSPFTAALLAHLEEPGLEVQFLFRKVRDRVLDATQGRQEPFTYGSLPGVAIYLRPPQPSGPAPGAVAPPLPRVALGGAIQPALAAMPQEPGIDRPGQDYRQFELAAADPSQCAHACAAEAPCRAWTFVKPGIQGPQARCWLKHQAPEARPHPCCVSGVKPSAATGRAVVVDHPTIDGIPLDYCLTWATDCGMPAADAYCRARGYARATSYQHAPDSPPTKTLGDRQECRQPFCDALAQVVCE